MSSANTTVSSSSEIQEVKSDVTISDLFKAGFSSIAFALNPAAYVIRTAAEKVAGTVFDITAKLKEREEKERARLVEVGYVVDEQSKLSAAESKQFEGFLSRSVFRVKDLQESEQWLAKNISKMSESEKVRLGEHILNTMDEGAKQEIKNNPEKYQNVLQVIENAEAARDKAVSLETEKVAGASNIRKLAERNEVAQSAINEFRTALSSANSNPPSPENNQTFLANIPEKPSNLGRC